MTAMHQLRRNKRHLCEKAYNRFVVVRAHRRLPESTILPPAVPCCSDEVLAIARRGYSGRFKLVLGLGLMWVVDLDILSGRSSFQDQPRISLKVKDEALHRRILDKLSRLLCLPFFRLATL